MIDYPKELARIRELKNYEYQYGLELGVYRYREDIDILLSYINELSTVKAIDAVLGQELKSLNKLRDNLNDFIKDNKVVLKGGE